MWPTTNNRTPCVMPIPAMSATQRRVETRTDDLAADFLAKYPVAIANSCRPRQFFTRKSQLSTIRATAAAGRRAALNRDEAPIALIDRPALQLPLWQQSIRHPGCRRDTLSAVPELREYEEAAAQEGNDPAHRTQVAQMLK